MSHYRPIDQLATHAVFNQPPPLEGHDAWAADLALREAVRRHGGDWAEDRLAALGRIVGSAETIELGRQANRHVPELRTFDRYGRRIDEVEFHPSYHRLMALTREHEVPTIAWTAERGGHLAHTALTYLFYQAEAGVLCSSAMCYAGIPVLRHAPGLAREWEPALLSKAYDPRCLPVSEKSGATMGMAMTEKQGGSDVRANTTRAVADGDAWRLTGHKWFCSMPMSDCFLTLAYTGEDKGLSCFFVPRWTPDGERNVFRIQRLKDKLGNRSNASSEIEYDGTWATLVGEEGRGVRTIMEMVHHTRLDVTIAPAAIMRLATVQAIHHACHRRAFQRRLVRQPLMQNVLADLALESEAAAQMILRVGAAFDGGAAGDEAERGFARIGVALAKYWLNKRVVPHVHEAMECLGGAGYIEESDLPRLYREAPLNGIWEGTGNVNALDLLRAMRREPGALDALLGELRAARGADARFDRALAALDRTFAETAAIEAGARRLAEAMALLLQGSLLIRFAPHALADAFCASRLGGDGGRAYGTLPPDLPLPEIVERAWPAAA